MVYFLEHAAKTKLEFPVSFPNDDRILMIRYIPSFRFKFCDGTT